MNSPDIPGGQGTYAGLIQTDVATTSDADIFIRALSSTTAGLGISSNYPAGFDYNSW